MYTVYLTSENNIFFRRPIQLGLEMATIGTAFNSKEPSR